MSSNEITTTQTREIGAFSNAQNFEMAQRMAKALMTADLVPDRFRNSLGNSMIALEMAQRINAAPLQVMQNLYVVHGTPAWSSKFMIATFNQCGKFTAIRYEWKGEPGADDYGCRAVCTERATGEKIEGMWITWQLVKAEGWNSKNGSKWRTMPEKMFQYRAAAWLIDVTAPEIAMGIPAAEQVEDIIDIDPATGEVLDKAPADSLEDALTASAEPAPEHNDTTPPMEIVISAIKDCDSRDDLAEVETMIEDWDKRTTAFKQVHQAIENRRQLIANDMK